MQKVVSFVLVLLMAVPDAYGCGGPSLVPVGSFLGSRSYIQHYLDRSTDGFYGPFAGLNLHPSVYTSDYQVEWVPFEVDPENLNATHNSAQKIVDLYLESPGYVKGVSDLNITGAVEFLELESEFRKHGKEVAEKYYRPKNPANRYDGLPESLAAASQNRPSQIWLKIGEDFRSLVTNGWGNAIAGKTKPEVWDQLAARHAEWLQKHPQHPTADFVRLSAYRIPYFKTQDQAANDEAWAKLNEVYKNKRGRAVKEMDFMTYQARYPSPEQLAKLDPIIIAGVMNSCGSWTEGVCSDDAFWNSQWNASSKLKDKRVAEQLQAALLAALLYADQRGSKIPASFPKPKKDSQDETMITRLATYLKYQSNAQALTQADMLSADVRETGAMLAARAYVINGRAAKAFRFKNLDDTTGHYLIQVGLTDQELTALAKSGGRFAKDAALMQGIKISRASGWDNAADVVARHDADRAKAWRALATLAKDKSPAGRLQYAQALKKTEFFPRESAYWRGVKWRHEQISRPDSYKDIETMKDEKTKLEWFLIDGDIAYRTLEAYVEYLKTVQPGAADAKEQLTAADNVYNYLRNAGVWENQYYITVLEGSPAAAGLRKEGARIRRG